jgi:hypothetical protein
VVRRVTEYAYLGGAGGAGGGDVLTEGTQVMPGVADASRGIAVVVSVKSGGGAYREKAY